MKLPKKIDDKVITSVVEIRYESLVPFSILAGYIYRTIIKNYKYTNAPIENKRLEPGEIGNGDLFISLTGHQHLFYSDKIAIGFQPNKIIFNSIDKYLGWDVYYGEITKALNEIKSMPEITSYSRIGMRYITEYLNQDLRESTKFNFSFGMPDVKSDTYSFHTKFKYKSYRVNLNLTSMMPSVEEIDAKADYITQIDIDIIKEELSITQIEVLLNEIDETHSNEKEIFFSLLREDFLKTLNPIY